MNLCSKDGEPLDDVALPDWMSTEQMRLAMGTGYLTKIFRKRNQLPCLSGTAEFLT
jgi:hypothetical protein